MTLTLNADLAEPMTPDSHGWEGEVYSKRADTPTGHHVAHLTRFRIHPPERRWLAQCSCEQLMPDSWHRTAVEAVGAIELHMEGHKRRVPVEPVTLPLIGGSAVAIWSFCLLTGLATVGIVVWAWAS